MIQKSDYLPLYDLPRAVEGLPVSLSFVAGQWEGRKVLEAGAAYERVRSAKLAVPGIRRWGE